MILSNETAFAERPSCVLLDLDHTLYDYEPCNKAGMIAAKELAMRQLGLRNDDFDRCFADARTELKHRLGKTAASHSRLLYFQRTVERAGFASQPYVTLQLEQAFWRAYLDVAQLYPEVLDFLDDLRILGIPAVIVTDLTAQIQLRKIVALGLDKLVDWVVTSEEAGRDKPDPAPFELALAKIGGIEGEIWMIGDNHDCDLSGARLAVQAVTLHKIDWRFQTRKSGVHADARFWEFGELRSLLAKLTRAD